LSHGRSKMRSPPPTGLLVSPRAWPWRNNTRDSRGSDYKLIIMHQIHFRKLISNTLYIFGYFWKSFPFFEEELIHSGAPMSKLTKFEKANWKSTTLLDLPPGQVRVWGHPPLETLGWPSLCVDRKSGMTASLLASYHSYSRVSSACFTDIPPPPREALFCESSQCDLSHFCRQAHVFPLDDLLSWVCRLLRATVTDLGHWFC
jgi:hypothetical protein